MRFLATLGMTASIGLKKEFGLKPELRSPLIAATVIPNGAKRNEESLYEQLGKMSNL